MKALVKILALVSLVVIGGFSIGIGVAWGPELSSRLLGDLSQSAAASNRPIAQAPGRRQSTSHFTGLPPWIRTFDETDPANRRWGWIWCRCMTKVARICPQERSKYHRRWSTISAFVLHWSRGMLDDSIETVGYVRYDERQIEEIHARVAGWLRRLHVRADGDPVELYGRLYDIYSPELISAQEEFLVALGSDDSLLIDASQDKLWSLGVSSGTIGRIREESFVIRRYGCTRHSRRGGFFDGRSRRLCDTGAKDTAHRIDGSGVD